MTPILYVKSPKEMDPPFGKVNRDKAEIPIPATSAQTDIYSLQQENGDFNPWNPVSLRRKTELPGWEYKALLSHQSQEWSPALKMHPRW